MEFLEKPSERPPSGEQNSTFVYRGKPEVNNAYIQQSPRAIRPGQDAGISADINRKTLIGTCCFLLGLLLVGYFAGYAVRGNSSAFSARGSTANLALSAITPPAGLDGDRQRSQLIATIGSPAPEELLAFSASADGDHAALIRLHDTSEANADAFSLVRFDPYGSSHEVLRLTDKGLKDMGMSRLTNGHFVTTARQADALDIQGYGPNGESMWSRQILVSANHKAGVRIIATENGAIIAGPSETADRIGLTYLGLDGELLWQRTFAADAETANIWLAPDTDGSFFLARRDRKIADTVSHTLTHISAEGQDLWRRTMHFDTGDKPAGLTATGDGGAYLLSTGNSTSLARYDSDGQTLWDAPLPQAKLFSSIHLVATKEGNAVIAISYAIAGERLDVWLEERDKSGELIGETNLTLPSSSAVDVITEATPGRYLLAGSIRANRFESTDIFVKDFKFKPEQNRAHLVAAAMTLEPALTAPEEPRTEALQMRTVNALESMPEVVIETVPFETDEIDATNIESVTVAEPVKAEPVAARETEALASPSYPLAAEKLAVGNNSLGAAVSRLLAKDEVPTSQISSTERIVRAQCRFTCIDAANSSEAFHMWRAVEATEATFAASLAEQHVQACRVAAGIVNKDAEADCQPG